MTTVGYARVSSTGQDLALQLEKLQGCEKVFKEKRSGVDAGRPELKRCLEYLREGDTLLVTKIDRLARSTSDLCGRLSRSQRSPKCGQKRDRSPPEKVPGPCPVDGVQFEFCVGASHQPTAKRALTAAKAPQGEGVMSG